MIHPIRVDVLVKTAGIERGVVIEADGGGYGVCGWWQEAATLAHKVLGQSHLCVEAKVEASALVSAAHAPEARSVGVGAVVVARHSF